MYPPFRSNRSLSCFCALLVGLLVLPAVAARIGLTSREQAFSGLTDEAGRVEAVVYDVFRDPRDSEIVLLGSSILRNGVDQRMIEAALSQHLHRPAKVAVLAMNWQGLDLQYFMLRDYLDHHHTSLVLWNPPLPETKFSEPHIESFRWMRYGEYSDALSGLPLRDRAAIFGEMVLGAPRQLYARVRPNRIDESLMTAPLAPSTRGYYGRPFVKEDLQPPHFDGMSLARNEQTSAISYTGAGLDDYQTHFLRKISELVRAHNARIGVIHIPVDSEYGMSQMPERTNWAALLQTQELPYVGVPAGLLFPDMSKQRYTNFYFDQHFNINGRTYFTQAILPGVLESYDHSH